MKYFIHYPILFDCFLRCDYCFHKQYYQNYEGTPVKYNVGHWNRFRDKHLTDVEEIVVNLYGGETFIDTNTNIVTHFIKCTENETVDLLTNGLADKENYKKIIPFKDRIFRLGFTYHRKMIHNVPSLVKRFEDNINFLQDAGLNVYVKELLFADYRFEIVEAKKKWKEKGIEFKIQDFREDANKNVYRPLDIIPLDAIIVDREYQHIGKFCECKHGYKNLIIRNGWDEKSHGDILGCWYDPKVVGNIITNTFEPDYEVVRNRNTGGIEVNILKNDNQERYRGTYEGDKVPPEDVKFLR